IRRFAQRLEAAVFQLPGTDGRGGEQSTVRAEGERRLLARQRDRLAPLLAVVDADDETVLALALPGDGGVPVAGRHARPAALAENLRRHNQFAARAERDKDDLV